MEGRRFKGMVDGWCFHPFYLFGCKSKIELRDVAGLGNLIREMTLEGMNTADIFALVHLIRPSKPHSAHFSETM